MKKYQATFYFGGSIKEIEVTRETEHFFFYILRNYERKEKKVTESSVLFDTWSQAHDWLMKKSEENVDSAQRSLRSKQEIHLRIEAMKNTLAN